MRKPKLTSLTGRSGPLQIRRRAVSEVQATVLLIAMTLIAGAALFGYVNGQAANGEKAIGGQYGNNINYLNERESISFVSFSTNQVFVWVYNAGSVSLSGFTLFVSGPTCTGNQGSANCASPTTATFMCSYSGSCNWIDSSLSPSTGSCGSLIDAPTPPNQPIVVGSSAQAIQISLGSCSGSSPSYFAKSSSLTNSFTLTFEGQFNSQASTTKSN